MVLHLCGICEKETNLSGLTELNETIMDRVHLSDMRLLYRQLVSVKEDAKSCDIAYAAAVYEELTADGIFKGAKYACKECVRQLPKIPKKKANAVAVALDAECMEEGVIACDNAVIDVDDEDIVDEDVSEAENNVSDEEYVRRGGVPLLAVVNGFFRGTLI